MNRLHEIESCVNKEYLNITKSKGRPRSLQGILEKTNSLTELEKEYKSVLTKIYKRIEPEIAQALLNNYEQIKYQVKTSIKILDETPVGGVNINSQVKSGEVPTLESLAKNAIDEELLQRLKLLRQPRPLPPRPLPKPKMTNDTFDIKTATAIVQPYNGSPEGLAAFIDATSLLNELTTDAHQGIAVKFLKSRLTGKARLGLPDTALTITQVAQNVKQRCASKTTPENVVAKLKATKQKGEVDRFCTEVDTLCQQLRVSYLESGVPDQVALKMATKSGVEALTEGVANNETKIILKAGNFDNIESAIQKVIENTSSSSSSNAQVFMYNNNSRQSDKGNRNNYSSRGGYHQNYKNNRYQNNRNYYQSNHQRNNRQNDNFHQNRNQGHYNNNYQQNRNQGHYNNNNTRGRGGQNNTRRVYATNTQETNQAPAYHTCAPQGPSVQMNAPPAQMPAAVNPNIFLGNPYGPMEPIQGQFSQ